MKEKEKIILAIFELEEMIKMEKDKETKKYLKVQCTKLNNKLKRMKEENENR